MDAIDLCLDISPVTHFAYGQTFARVRDGINEFSANIIQFGRLFMAKSSQVKPPPSSACNCCTHVADDCVVVILLVAKNTCPSVESAKYLADVFLHPGTLSVYLTNPPTRFSAQGVVTPNVYTSGRPPWDACLFVLAATAV